ncbi:beta-ketoacyl synthase N-terminal-like domain-containing protein [Frankia nepalensis]|uniref:beta-ketoacyl synthase N-terminal-like domain-containing protein n=1 Tax=Frankia nepalensis TaxID=1836974 RepID=UPI0038995C57
MAPPDEDKLRSYLKRVVGELGEVRRRSKSAEERASEPVAIVAMSCRMPAGVRSPEDLWELVAAGKDAVGEFPDDRGWDLAGLYDPDPDRPGTSYVRHGGFIPRIGGFDAAFFGVSDAEALVMDPQQRLLLECTWEALERAGVDPTALRGSATGVYAGCSVDDYTMLLADPPEDLAAHRLTGGGNALAARISGAFGLTGPAVTVDTACSSSLVALHLAAAALRRDECSLALVSGVSVISTPQIFVDFSRQRGLAPDGRVKAFAEAADGTAWCDAVGTLVVERLSDARRLGHRVLAVVRGSAVNQDGASNGLTAPNGPSQQRVIRAALNSGLLSPAEVDAVEAHGTGTRLGDPIEAEALLRTYGQGRPADRPLWLGSVKSNFGHPGAAAGVIGVIKMVLALRHGLLPATLNVDRPTPMVDWAAGAVDLLSEARPWPVTGRPRRAGVSAFGVSGTNAHVILEEAPPAPAPTAEPSGADARTGAGGPPAHGGAAAAAPLLVSAASPEALRDQARALSARLAPASGLRRADVAHALATTRAALPHRAAVLAEGSGVAGLDLVARGEPAPGVLTATARDHGRVAFVLPEHGGGLLAAALDLLDSDAAFAARLAACAAAVERHVPWRVEAVLRGEPGAPPLASAEIRRPVLFAVGTALAGVWQDRGVRADAVAGPWGGIVGDHLAGALALEEAARLVVAGGPARGAGPTVGALLADGYRAFVVIGADGDAAGLGEAAPQAGLLVLAALPVERGLAEAWVNGLPVAWPAPAEPRPVDLPTYPFQHKDYWVRAPAAAAAVPAGAETGFWTAVEERDATALAGLLGASGHGAVGPGEVEPALPALAALLERSRQDAAVAHWRYRTEWREVPPPALGELSGHWLVLVPASLARTEPWSAALERRGATVTRLAVPAGVERAALAEDLAMAMAARPPRGVVSALPMDDTPHPGHPGLLAGLTGTLRLVGALIDLGVEAPVWSLTRGAVAAVPGDGADHPAQAGVWGLGLALAEEHPRLWGGTVDLPAHDAGLPADGTAADLLAAVLTAGGGEDRIALRGSAVLARRLARAPLERRPGRRAWRPAGTVLVTDGTHGTGLVVARWLASAGARHLLLTTAREPDPRESAAREAEFAALGARVTIARCAFADRAEGARLLASLPADEPLTSVFHCAEVLEESPLEAAELPALERVLRARTAAADTLDELTRGLGLSAFVLFSSIAGSIGVGVGLGGFAAASAHLDALALRRRAAGEPATAVAWGVWAEEFADPARAALEQARHERLRRRGIPAIAPDRALTVLRQALDADETALLATEIDWPDYLRATAAGRGPLFAEIPEAAVGGRADRGADDGQALPARLAGLDAAGRRAAVADVVRAQIAAVLGLPGGRDVDMRRGLLELGMDSLTTVELRNRLTGAAGVALTTRQILDHPTPEALTAYLDEQLGGARAAGAAAPVPASAGSTLTGLFEAAVAAGRAGEFTDLLAVAAGFRPTFDDADGAAPADPVPLTRGDAHPVIFCLPTVLATSGPEQFARLAAGFGGGREVSALALPGFRAGEPLPATREVLAEALAGTVRRSAAGRPYTLLGYSSGGLLALDTAAWLEAEGAGPAAVVLLDTFQVDGGRLDEFGPALLTAMARRAEATGLDDARLSAMGGYLRLLAGWRPMPPAAPTLLVRAAGHDWGGPGPNRAELSALCAALDVSGDHFTLIEERAAETARAVLGWLARLPTPAAAQA